MIDKEEFDVNYLYKIMRSLFPKKNDCGTFEQLAEVATELKQFSICTKLEVRLFLKKYRRKLLEIDKQPLDLCHQKIYREMMGEEVYNDAIRRQYWFCYPALIRTAMEIEFGQQYEQFTRQRDYKEING